MCIRDRLSLCAENARAHQRVPHPYPAVGGVASCLAYALVARLFAAVSSSPPGGGKRTRAGERAAAAALCAWCGLGVLFEATCPSDRFYVAPRTDAGGRDGEAAVRLVALSAGFAAALLAVAAPPAVELREAPATPEEAASLLSFVTFGYFTPVVDRGAAPKRYQLSGGDVPPVAPDAGAAACLRAFEGAFDGAPASAFWLGPALAPWDFWTAAAFQLGAAGIFETQLWEQLVALVSDLVPACCLVLALAMPWRWPYLVCGMRRHGSGWLLQTIAPGCTPKQQRKADAA